jgi:hypothetical protein
MPVDLTRYSPKPSKARRFFDQREVLSDLGLFSADSLFSWLAAGARHSRAGVDASALAGSHVVYRGQPNADYGLSPSLYRACRAVKADVREADLAVAESAVIAAMRGEGVGRCMSDIELLQVLQHHGIPTRLVDVSTGPLEALFFAVDRNDGADGRLFLIRLDAESEGDALLDKPGRPLPWEGMAHGQTRALDAWTQTLALIEADPLDPRMRAQKGKFLVGGLNRRTVGRIMGNVSALDFAQVSSLGVNFIRQLRVGRNSCWPATGWTIRVPAEWKPHLRMRLASLPEPITLDAMYPPLSEVRRLAMSCVRTALGNS